MPKGRLHTATESSALPVLSLGKHFHHFSWSGHAAFERLKWIAFMLYLHHFHIQSTILALDGSIFLIFSSISVSSVFIDHLLKSNKLWCSRTHLVQR